MNYTYARSGRIASVADATGTRIFAYDPAQPLQLDSIALGTGLYQGLVLTRQYNKDGLLPGRPSGFSLGTAASPSGDLEQDYYYNSLGRFDHLTSQALGGNAFTFNYSYTPNTPLIAGVAVSGSPFQVSRSYDPTRPLLTDVTTQWATEEP
ncbi:MAG: hypothetical protein ACREFX_03195, partial [Opitutaceae bacterium]